MKRLFWPLGVALVLLTISAQSPVAAEEYSIAADWASHGTTTYDASCGLTCDDIACGEAMPTCGSPGCDCLGCRHHLSGGCGGYRDWMRTHGITVEGTFTQFYQGVASGGNKEVFRYGDKLDVFAIADLGKLGLCEGGTLTLHAVDWQFGQNVILDATGLAPVNTALLTPRATESAFAMTSLLYTQQLGGGYAMLGGRMNMLDLWTTFYPNYGRGIDGFMNTSMMLPLSIIPTVPLVTNGAGLVKAGERGIESAFIVLESQSSPTTTGLDFPNGVTMLAMGRKYTDFFGLPGSHTVVGVYATGEYTSYDTQGWIVVPGQGIIPDRQKGSWAATYLGEQRIWSDSCNPKRYTNLFGYVGFSDVDNSPYNWTAAVSLEKFGPFACRPNDRAGIGYFYNALNGDFRDTVSILAPINDLHGGEVYYNAQITKWFNLTTDVQVINPGLIANDTAVVLGLRGRIAF